MEHGHSTCETTRARLMTEACPAGSRPVPLAAGLRRPCGQLPPLSPPAQLHRQVQRVTGGSGLLGCSLCGFLRSCPLRPPSPAPRKQEDKGRGHSEGGGSRDPYKERATGSLLLP